ncbi:hypothetical protein [Rubrimonas cliftonensis]|uniref:Uncharacterized protein n=1 Tax=Rubrimonas cliftonensis TaxID=89524 RepID=A0A1H3YTS5_9RHOB|nr:hypothetical protein [Rubrimonas cliftonensis]SEA14817.1 hypothetical protein SAMN05444370_103243 [Rubrimonas cliftonensis]
MTEAEAKRVRARGMAGLGVAAVAIAALGLGGPAMLAATGDPSPVLPYYPFGWAIAIGGWLYWLRSWRAARRSER